HRSSLGPGGSKGLVAEFRLDRRLQLLVVGTFAESGKEREQIEETRASRRTTKHFGHSPQVCCPGALSPAREQASPLPQADCHALPVTHLPEARDTVLTQRGSFAHLTQCQGSAG